MITDILLVMILLVLAASIVSMVLIARRVKQTILDFIVPREQGKPSDLAITAEVLASMIGRAVTAQIKTTLMGMQSGENRGQASINGAIAQDRANQMGFGNLLQSFPVLSRTIKKNPSLMDFAMNVLAQRMAGTSGNHPSNGSGPEAESPKFNL